jgi:hypothetical protein
VTVIAQRDVAEDQLRWHAVTSWPARRSPTVPR